MAMKAIPGITQELVDALASRFRDQSPDLKDSDREVWFKAGQVSVVRFLKNELDRQVKKAMET